MANEQTFTTGSGATWIFHRNVRCSLPEFQPNKELGYFPNLHLTGNFEDHNLGGRGEIESMVEIADQYGQSGMVWEQFISQ